MPEQQRLNERLLRLAPETGLPLVVTNDLNQAILARLIESGILDPKPMPSFKLHGLEHHLALDSKDGKDGHAASPP